MSRTFVDENLHTWEVFPSGGRFGLPERPKIVFLCLSDLSPASRGRSRTRSSILRAREPCL